MTTKAGAPAPRRAAFALGANLGDRAGALRGAVEALAATDGIDVLAVSPPYETEPVGGPAGQPAYLNAVVIADTVLDSGELLDTAHAIEQVFGRARAERWGARTLDVDLLAVDAETVVPVETDALTLPHPRAHLRAFVLVPWADVDPGFELPGLGAVADLLAALPSADRAGVRRATAIGDLGLRAGRP